MADSAKEEKQGNRKISVSFTTEPTKIKIVSEPTVVFTQRGYAPVVKVAIEGEEEEKVMFISAASLSAGLEELRSENDQKFAGIEAVIRKESTDRFAKYIVEGV